MRRGGDTADSSHAKKGWHKTGERSALNRHYRLLLLLHSNAERK